MRALYHHRTQGRSVEAVHIRGLCSGLERLGYDVEIVGPPGTHPNPDLVESPAVGKTGLTWGWVARHLPQLAFECLEIGYNLAAVPRLWKRCRELKPELIYERYALYNAAGVLVGRMTGTPVVLEINDTVDVDRERQGKKLVLPGLARWFERQIFQRASGVVAVSGYLRDQAIAAGVPPERVRVTPNAVNPERFDRERVDGGAVRARHGLEGKTVLGFVGSFAKWHGVDLLIRAASTLARDFPQVSVLLIGDGHLRPQMEALVAELGITDRVVFTGKIPHMEIPAHVAAMDVGVVPGANVFVSPVKVFEYMAMGCPPVAARYRPLEDAIDEGKDGLIFEANDLEALTRSLRELLADPERRRALGEAAHAKIMARHLWVHNARVVVELVQPGHPNRAERVERPEAVPAGSSTGGAV